MYKTGKGIDIDFNEIPQEIEAYYKENKNFGTPLHIIVGTDSQNFSDTKMVSVIALWCEGHGGRFFYEITRQPIIRDIKTKLFVETNSSLEIATKLVNILEQKKYEEVFINSTFSIHIDAGNNPNGKTKDLIPGLVGWIKSCGYDCEIKPDSFVASSIADKISK